MDKKVPMRTCVACRESKPKRELLRIVRTERGILPDKTGKMNGRGAYICKNAECVDKMKKRKVLNKAFACQVEDGVYELIAEAILGEKE